MHSTMMAERFMTDKTGRRKTWRWFCHAAKGNQNIQKLPMAAPSTRRSCLLMTRIQTRVDVLQVIGAMHMD
jgi:hypothetical protein